MKHTTIKLITVLCFILLLAFAAIIVAFHFIMDSYIKTNAYEAVSYAVKEVNSAADTDKYESENEDSSTMAASWLLVDKSYNSFEKSGNKQQELTRWCKEHPDLSGDISHMQINHRTYYVAQVKGNPKIDGIWLLYVEVTAEKALINSVDFTMLVIMAFCAGIACFAGIHIGVSIERGQMRQKKFFENVSHELKTPLMSIQGYAEGVYDGIITDQEHAVCVIMNETDKMTALVDEILCLSRIESGETRLNIESVSVQEVVNNCLVSLESVILKKKLKVETHLAEGNVQADATQLETAVTNLLVNAVKYAENWITISFDGRELSVWNDGYKISKEEAAHIFDRFYIGKNGNTGIGLALTKEIIERHGWKICVETKKNSNQFIIHFPNFSRLI